MVGESLAHQTIQFTGRCIALNLPVPFRPIVVEKRNRLLAADAGEVIEEDVQAVATLDVVQKPAKGTRVPTKTGSPL